jgi:hypothetical protein
MRETLPKSYLEMVNRSLLLKFDLLEWAMDKPPSHARDATHAWDNQLRVLHKTDWNVAVPGMKTGDEVQFRGYRTVIREPTVRGFLDAIYEVVKKYRIGEKIVPKVLDLFFEGHVERHVDDDGKVYWDFAFGT